MTLESDLRGKVKSHVQAYLQLQPNLENSVPLSRIKVYSYIQERDRTLARKKKVQIEKMIDVVCRDLESQNIGSDHDLIEIDDEPVLSVKDVRHSTMFISSKVLMRQDTIKRDTNEDYRLSPGTTPLISETFAKRKERPNNREPRAKRTKGRSSISYMASPIFTQLVEETRSPPENISLADLGGVESCITEVLEMIVMPLTHPEVYVHTGVPTPR